MCGIAGVVSKLGALPEEGLLRRMSERIAHRGPDAEKMWLAPGVGLAHRRLAIIDLSPGGIQPMQDGSGRYTIVFNGEIYNYRELRAELESSGATFRTSSDTEVILEAYRVWGLQAFSKLRGMFAFALWDAETSQLVLSRDKIGKKPLFYATTPSGDLAFASEMKALSVVVPFKPDMEAVRLFLGLQYVPSPRTGFLGVMQLEPGTYGVWQKGSWKMETYHIWDRIPPPALPRRGSVDDEIRSTLEDAVKIRQLAADVPVGAFLSGGVDSAAVVALASKHVSQPLRTFTMGFPELHMDERREARAIAEAFHTEHEEFEARPEHLQALVDELVTHYDAPYADSSALPLWLLAQQTSKEIKVVLTGDGGDETFGGYRRYSYFDRALQLASIPVLSRIAAPASLWLGNMLGDVRFGRMGRVVEQIRRDPAVAYGEMFCGSYFGTTAVHDMCTSAFCETTESADAVQFVAANIRAQGARSPLDGAMRFDLTSYLPDDLNVKMDRATMRFGLEARAPFLDEKVVQLALGLPLSEKVSGSHTKIALKRALRGIVPDDVLHRRKRGFQVPLAQWFRGPLRQLIVDRCLDPQGQLASIVKLPEIQRLLEQNDRGADHGNRLWMLLTLATWLNIYAH